MIGRQLQCLALTWLLVSVGSAQISQGERQGGDLINDVDQSKVAMHPATPYMERSTVLIVDLDLSKLDVQATSRWLNETFGGAEGDGATEMVRGFVDSLRGAGVSNLYVTAATRSLFDGGPLVVVPCQNPTVVQGLATVILQNLPDSLNLKVQMGDKQVLVGAATAIDRVVAAEGYDRPDLILPLTESERLDHNIVISLPAEARRDLAALWPGRVPDSFPIQFSPRQMVQDVNQIVISLRLPPDPKMMIEIEATHAVAAGRVKDMAEKLIATTGDVGKSIDVDVQIEKVTLRASPEVFARLAQAVISPAQQNATQMMVSNTMKQIGLAIHNYYANEKTLPPLYYASEDGKPLLSGRVALLPYIEQQAMFQSVKLDQAWDSEANLLFSQTLIPTYCFHPDLGSKTTIRFPVFPGSVWDGDGPPKDFRDVRDGSSRTIAAIDAPVDAAVEWANPKPWILSEDDPMSDVFGDRESATVVLLDGAALVLRKSEMTNAKLKAMLTIDGGELIE